MKIGNTHFSKAGIELVKKMDFDTFNEAYQGLIKGVSMREAFKQLGGGKAQKISKKSKSAESESDSADSVQ